MPRSCALKPPGVVSRQYSVRDAREVTVRRSKLIVGKAQSLTAGGDRNIEVQPFKACLWRARIRAGSVGACGHEVERTGIRSDKRRQRHRACRVDIRAEVPGYSPPICCTLARRDPNVDRAEISVTIAR